LVALLRAQDQAPAGPAQAPAQESGTISNSANNSQNGRSNDRLFYTLPNFLTVEGADSAPPLTPWEKFKLTSRDAFDPVEFLWYGVQTGIAQAKNEEPGYGQGMKGFGERFGERFADGALQNFMTHPIFGSILHQDPRYYQLGKGGFLRRTGCAMSRVLITRSDSGARQVNVSEIFGSAAAAGISTYTYHPRDDRNVRNAASVWGSQMLYDAIGYLAKEFWPDIHRKLHRKSETAQAR